MSQNIFKEVFSNMNILDVEVGTIAEGMNIDGVDENSTVSEAMADVDTTRFFPKRTHEIEQSRKMMSSAFPVDIKLTGRALCIKSEYNQMLPVYSASGVLYMAMHLNKGTNWLNGLPKGHYFINSRPLTIP